MMKIPLGVPHVFDKPDPADFRRDVAKASVVARSPAQMDLAGVYLVGLALMLYLIVMGREYRIELTNMLPQSIIGLTGCFLIIALTLLYAGEKEENLQSFSIHRGWNPYLIHTAKISLAVASYVALIAALYLSRTLLLAIAGIKIESVTTSGDIVYAFYVSALMMAWALLASYLANTVINAIGITFAGLVAQQLLVAFLVHDDQLLPMILLNAVLIASVILIQWSRSSGSLQSRWKTLTQGLPIPSNSGGLPKTESLPREQAMRLHLKWLHAHERRLIWFAGVGVVLFSLAACPMASLMPDEGSYLVLFALIIPAFYCTSSLLTFHSEHANSNYRFWNDRGLPWQTILRSRLFGFLVAHLTMIVLSLVALCVGFLMVLFLYLSPKLTLSRVLSELQQATERDPQFFRTIWVAFHLLLPIATVSAFFYSWMFRSPMIAFVAQLLTLIALFAYAALTYNSFDIPLWLTLYPLAAVVIYLIFTRYPVRFQAEIPGSLYRVNTFAIVATFLISTTAIAFYRIYQVPGITGYRNYDSQLIHDTHSINQKDRLDPLVVGQLVSTSAFYKSFKEIAVRITPRPYTITSSPIMSYKQALIENYGFDYMMPRSQEWTRNHLAEAYALKDLVNATPSSQILFDDDYSLDLGNPVNLLLDAGKYSESTNDLQTAAEFYIAHNRLIEPLFGLGGTMSINFRSRLRRHITSWLTHPSQPVPDREELLTKIVLPTMLPLSNGKPGLLIGVFITS